MVHSAQGHITVRRRPRDGENSSSYWLVVSDSVVSKKEDGSFYPSKVSCMRIKQVGKDSPEESAEGALMYQLSNQQRETQYTGPVTISSGAEWLKFTWKIGGCVVSTKTVQVISGGQAFLVDVDDENIPVAVINAGIAYGQEQKVNVNAFIGSTKIPSSQLTYSVRCSNTKLFTASRTGSEITIQIYYNGSWANTKKETVSIGVTSAKYGSRTVTISLYPTFPGKDSCIYTLYTTKSSLAFGRDASNNITGTETLEIKIRKHIGTDTGFVDYNPSKNGLKIYSSFDDSVFTPKTESPVTVTVSSKTAKAHRYLFVELWEGERIRGTLLDRESIPLLIDGEKGEPGGPGGPGNSVTDVVNYYKKSTNGEVAPAIDATWEPTAPPLDRTYRYLWNFERTHYTQKEAEDSTARVIAYYSEDGKGIDKIMEEFGVSSDYTTVPTEWFDDKNIPKMDAFWKYLWNRETIIYTDKTEKPITAHIVGVYGEKGDKGDKGEMGLSANPNLLNATSFKSVGKHDDKWNVRITTDWRKSFAQAVNDHYAMFADVPGGLFGTNYMYAQMTKGTSVRYIELLQQCIVYSPTQRKVRKNTWYTLSFYLKGKLEVYILTYKTGQKIVEADGYVDGERKVLPDNGHCHFDAANSNEYTRHTITFRTTNIDSSSHVLFRMKTENSDFPVGDFTSLSVSLCCIKLEEGKEATPWCRSERDLRGSRPEYPIWQEGQYFYCGEDGEDVFSICEFGSDSSGDPRYYICKKTLDVPSKLGENDPETSISKNKGIWEAAKKNDFMLAGRIAAHRIDTDSLITNHFYSISDDKSRSVKIDNGIIEIFGKGAHSNIRLGLDKNGCAILEFYDQNGVFQYGLGPGQIDSSNHTRYQRWEIVKMLYLNTNNMGTAVQEQGWRTDKISGNDYYRYVSEIDVAGNNKDADNDQRIFSHKLTAASNRINGIFVMGGTRMFAKVDESGNPIVTDKHQNNPTLGFGTVYMRTLLEYNGGKIVSRQNVYWTDSLTDI